MQLGNKLRKAAEDLATRCNANVPNIRNIQKKLEQVEAAWLAYDRANDVWANNATEEAVNVQEQEYNSLVEAKDSAVEAACKLIEADKKVNESQIKKGKVDTEVKTIEGILESIQSKVDETTVADSKLEGPVADTFLKQLGSLDKRLEALTLAYDNLIAADADSAEVNQTAKADKLKDLTKKKTSLNAEVLGLQSVVVNTGAGTATTAHTAGAAVVGGAFNFYEKKPFLKFSGSKRE